MTANQVIVLLDIKRGFNKSRHLGTVDEDVKMLLKEGLIKEGASFPYELTETGEVLTEKILERAGGNSLSLGITAHDGLLWRGKESIPLPEADLVAQSHGYPYAEQLVEALSEGRKISPDKQPEGEKTIS
jgi:hypothetical protein